MINFIMQLMSDEQIEEIHAQTAQNAARQTKPKKNK